MASCAPPVPILFPATKLKRFRTLDDNAYPLTTYLANEDAQLIISEGFETDERDAAITFQVCQRALAKFPFSVDAFLEMAYLYETYWDDLDKTKTAYDRAIKCCECLWPELEQVQADSDVELHEMRLLQQAYFGLANVELDLGNFDTAMQHVATLERLDPTDASGNRAMFQEKYESIMNPSAIAKEDEQHYSEGDAESDAADDDFGDSDTDSFYYDSGEEFGHEDDKSIESEPSAEDVGGGSSSSSSSSSSNQSDNAQLEPLIKKENDLGMLSLPMEVSTESQAESHFPQTPVPDSPLPTSSPSKTSPRKTNRYLSSKPTPGNADKTLATSYLLSANVSLENGDIDAALEHARSLMKADPKDECGCLWKFFERFVRANFEEEDVEHILSCGPSSCECYFRYCFIILDIMKLDSGDATVDKVHATIIAALQTNPLVPGLLLLDGDLPDCTTQPVPGGMSEAIWYCKTDRETWDGVEEAIRFLNDIRFHSGPKPEDDGQILRSLLPHFRVLVDMELQEPGRVQTYECTTQGNPLECEAGLPVDLSLITCYAIPVKLDCEGRRLEGKSITFRWNDVHRVHFWHLLYTSKFLVEKKVNSSILSRSFDLHKGSDSCRGLSSQNTFADVSVTGLPLEKEESLPSCAKHAFKSAIIAINKDDIQLALENVQKLLEVDPKDETGLFIKLFQIFIRHVGVKDDSNQEMPASRENAETYFRWRFVILAKKKVDDGIFVLDELDETIVLALQRNSFVLGFLLRNEECPSCSRPCRPGSMQEASWYVNIDRSAWNDAPGAIEALLLARFRDGLKPQDDGALLTSLFERCKLTIDLLASDDSVSISYECCTEPEGREMPNQVRVNADPTGFVCYAVPTQLRIETESPEGCWMFFKYESVEKIPFWRILIDSKHLMAKREKAPIFNASLGHGDSLSDLSAGSGVPKESMLRRALKRSSLSNKSLSSSDSVPLLNCMHGSVTKRLADSRKEAHQGTHYSAAEDARKADHEHSVAQLSKDSINSEDDDRPSWYSSISRSRLQLPKNKGASPTSSPRHMQRRSIRQSSASRVALLRNKLFVANGKKVNDARAVDKSPC